MLGENSADFSHLDYVHDKRSTLDKKIANFLGLKENLINQKRNNMRWRANRHNGILNLDFAISFCGYQVGSTSFTATQMGPFFSNSKFRINFFGRIFNQEFILAVTSLHPNKQRIVVRMFAENSLWARLIGRASLLGVNYLVSILKAIISHLIL